MVSGSAPAVWRGGGGRRACETGGDGESARWPRRGLTTSRKVGAPQGKGAGESQGGATCRYRATESRSDEHTSELQSLMRISYAVFCLKQKKYETTENTYTTN